MCGIIAVLRRRSRRRPPPASILDQAVTAATATFDRGPTAANLTAAATTLGDLDQQLRGIAGLRCLLDAPAAAQAAGERLRALQERLQQFESTLDHGARAKADDELEQRNGALVQLKDALWAVLRDRLPHAAAVRDLAALWPPP